MLRKEEIEKDLEILEDITHDDLLNCWEGGEREYEALQRLIQAYKEKQVELQETKEIKETLEFANISIKELLHYKYRAKQLETDKQNLIDKLEEDIEEYRKCMDKTDIKLNKIHYMKRIEYAKEILEILKGE